jgi:hypothetical protein
MSTTDIDKKYAAFHDDHKATFQLSGEYAKWFISTLLLLNSGAIAAIFQKGATANYACAFLILGLGIMLALGAGFTGWLNLFWASRHYRESAEKMIEGTLTNQLPSKIRRARLVAVTLSISSAACLFLGAIFIWRQL